MRRKWLQRGKERLDRGLKGLKRSLKRIWASDIFRLAALFLVLFIVTGLMVYAIEAETNEGFGSVFDGLWWAIITFSTTGYGDKVPATPLGRVVAVVTILIGISLMSVLSGTFASFFVDRSSRARRGLLDFSKRTGHFIVCGWKTNMDSILGEILQVSDDLNADDMVIISNINMEDFESLRETPGLDGVNYVRGDYFSETALKRANVQGARKVLVLADTFETGTISEVDSKTVMTVLTVKALAKDVYVCAELLDRKYENYLRQAQCDEILFSRDFSRRLLANTSSINGLGNIFQDLLAHEGDSRIITCEIPREFIGQEFSFYRDAFRGVRDSMLVGVLENTGSPNRIKLEALREAQKTSDISQLVTNLQTVKGLEINKPVLIPPGDYVIQPHSMAILLERRREQ